MALIRLLELVGVTGRTPCCLTPSTHIPREEGVWRKISPSKRPSLVLSSGPHRKMARTCFRTPFSTPIAIENEVGGTHAEHLTCRDLGLYLLRRTAGVLSDDGAGLFAVDQRVWPLTWYALGCFYPNDSLCRGRFALVDGASSRKALRR